MEEKVIVVGKVRSLKLFRNVCLILALGIFVWIMADYVRGYTRPELQRPLMLSLKYCFTSDIWVFEAIPVAIGIVGMAIYLWFSKVQITVTDKRVYGVIAGGKRVDLPLDSISAIAAVPFKGIVVTTASGGIKFLGIQNRDEIHDSISKLLLSRQNNKSADRTMPEKDEADSLVKYKKLLDDGAITQEEYEAKKKQLLGL